MSTARQSRIVVFSDVDETLIACKSLLDFLDFYRLGRYGPAGAAEAATVRAGLTVRAAGGERRESLNRTYFRSWRGEAEREVTAWGRRWFAERSQEPGGFFLPGTLAALRGHVADGAMLVLVSASFPALLAPIAEAVGASEVACTRPVVRGGRFTGELLGPPMAGTAKWNAVRTVLARHPEVAAADCYGYGDHVSDLPMLAEVGHPVVVGRSPELTRLLPGAGRLPGP